MGRVWNDPELVSCYFGRIYRLTPSLVISCIDRRCWRKSQYRERTHSHGTQPREQRPSDRLRLDIGPMPIHSCFLFLRIWLVFLLSIMSLYQNYYWTAYRKNKKTHHVFLKCNSVLWSINPVIHPIYYFLPFLWCSSNYFPLATWPSIHTSSTDVTIVCTETPAFPREHNSYWWILPVSTTKHHRPSAAWRWEAKVA